MLKKTISLIYFTTTFLLTFSQSKTDVNFHLYVLGGQSNMAGRGAVTAEFVNEGSPRVFMLDRNNEWVPAKHPLHFDKPSMVGVGPGLAFALQMLPTDPGVRIGLIPCAVGGSSINAWKPGAYDSSTKTHPYDDAMKRLSIAMKDGVVKGVLWHQGESDSDLKNAEIYLPKLVTLIQAFREATQQPDLPFVAGELGTYKDVYLNINKTISNLPRQLPFTAIASSKGLKEKGDMTHFDSPSAEELGKRYAKQMKMLQRKLKKQR